MQAVKGKRTGPERRLQAMLAARHIKGWRLNDVHLPGKPDFVFPNERLVVFVDGCFWHGCPHCQRSLPATNHDYWQRKIDRNRERDIRSQLELEENGWAVLRIWEHELASPLNAQRAMELVAATLSERTAPK